MKRRRAMLAGLAGLLSVPLLGCQVRVSGFPGVALGFGGLGGPGGFGNPAMRVGEPGWLVGIWAPEMAGCGLGQDVLFDANGDYRDPERFGRWFLIDGTLTVRGTPSAPGQPLSGQPVAGQTGAGQIGAGQPGFGPQQEQSWQLIDAAQDQVGLLSDDGTIVYYLRCAGASQLTGF